jgi:plastocyanin
MRDRHPPEAAPALTRRGFLFGAVVLSAAGGLTACGDGGPAADEASGAPDPETVAGSADAPFTAVTIVSTGLNFDKTMIFVPVGQPVTITYDNRHEGVPHNVHVTGNAVDSKTPVRPGVIVQMLVLTLPEAGRYDFVCDVHPVAMKGIIEAV